MDTRESLPFGGITHSGSKGPGVCPFSAEAPPAVSTLYIYFRHLSTSCKPHQVLYAIDYQQMDGVKRIKHVFIEPQATMCRQYYKRQ